MIAALLPKIAADLRVSVATAGSLVSVFALSYAVSSPVLTAATGALPRRRLLLGAMAVFALANLVAAAAHGYGSLAAARVLLACAAGIYTPNANALAGTLVPPARRGRAIAVVNGGLTVAIAIGVPLGALVGNRAGWRATFVGVALLSALALAGLAVGLPRGVGAGTATATLAERLRVARRPGVGRALLVTTTWSLGTYAVYTFLAPFLAAAVGVRGAQVGYVLLLWGASAGVGLAVGGRATDRLGFRPVIRASLGVLALALASLSVSARLLPGAALVPVVVATAVRGLSGWAFYPAQQARLIETTGARLAPVALSLNASFMYLGFSVGAALGGLTLARASVAHLGWVGGAFELLGLGVFLADRRARSAAAPALEADGQGAAALPAKISD